jgi:Flp pilus assembly protein TadG
LAGSPDVRPARSGSRRTRGQALVEFALTLPIMLLILLAVVDLGRAFYAGVVAEQAAREGVRLAMGAVPGAGVTVANIETQVSTALGYACTGCPNTLAFSAAPTVDVGGYDNTGAQFGRVNGSGTEAICASNCTGAQVRVEVNFNVPLYTGFLVERFGYGSIPVRGFASGTMW